MIMEFAAHFAIRLHICILHGNLRIMSRHFELLLCVVHVQAAAAMCVGVGSFSDPKDAQGLAHFLGKFVPLFGSRASQLVLDSKEASRL
jgi:hypothetical protein